MNNLHSEDIKVLSTHCDTIYRLSPTSMLSLFEAVADANTVELGVDGPTLRNREHAFWVISRVRLEINDIVKDHDDIRVMTWPAKAEGLRCGRSYRILKIRDERLEMRVESEELRVESEELAETVAVNGYADWVLLDTDTRGFRTADSVHFPEIQFITEKAVTRPFHRFKNIFTEDDFVYERVVRPSEIDVSHHTNNVKYCPMLLDSFSVKELEALNIKEIEIYYEAESHEGETLRIYRKPYENGWRFAIKRGEEIITMAFIGI